MIGWKEDKRWSDRFIPEITSILGQALIGPAPVEEDVHRNTDLMVLKMDNVRIGCRVRRNEYLRYKDEFTIRIDRPSGNKTEFAKIIEGYGDYFFYGICDEYETNLECYALCDLSVFRIECFKKCYKSATGCWGQMPWKEIKQNHDHSADFAVFGYDDFPEEFVVTKGPRKVAYAGCC